MGEIKINVNGSFAKWLSKNSSVWVHEESSNVTSCALGKAVLMYLLQFAIAAVLGLAVVGIVGYLTISAGFNLYGLWKYGTIFGLTDETVMVLAIFGGVAVLIVWAMCVSGYTEEVIQHVPGGKEVAQILKAMKDKVCIRVKFVDEEAKK